MAGKRFGKRLEADRSLRLRYHQVKAELLQ